MPWEGAENALRAAYASLYGRAARSGFAVMHPAALSAMQIRGFWAAWSGWVLDGMDSFIFALVLAPALTELLPKSGMDGRRRTSCSRIGAVCRVSRRLGLVDDRGPIADRYGRTRTRRRRWPAMPCSRARRRLRKTSGNWACSAFWRSGIGGEWALAGTYIAEMWPESRRKMGAGYLGTGYYVGSSWPRR